MISIVINLDTRPGFLEQESTDSNFLPEAPTEATRGARSYDFISHGIINKWEFVKKAGLEDKDIELIVFLDVHEDVPKELLDQLTSDKRISALMLRRNEKRFNGDPYPKFNDINYLQALVLARGKYIMHFDGDMAAFIHDGGVIREWMKLLDDKTYDYVSYNSKHSPNAVHDLSFDYMWASTRFFFCLRETFDYSESLKCLLDSEYLYGTYGDRKRRCPWTEHILGLIAGEGRVFYPPMDVARYMVFSWAKYKRGLYERLMKLQYSQVLAYVLECGGIQYPVDVKAR